MPFTLTTPRTINTTYDTLEINSYTVDEDNRAFHVAYDWGNIVDSNFVVEIKDKLITIDGTDYGDCWDDINATTATNVKIRMRRGIQKTIVRLTGEIGTET